MACGRKREVLPVIHVPALVLHRTNDLETSVDEGRWIAGRIPGARFVEHRGPEQIDDLIEQRGAGNGTKVQSGTVKIMLDGCPESCTAAMLDPYEGGFGRTHGVGIGFVEPER